jgi:hypothetical protein
MSMPVQNDIIDLKAIAKMLGLGYAMTLKLVNRGELPMVWRNGPGGTYRAFRADIEEYRDAQRMKKRDADELT